MGLIVEILGLVVFLGAHVFVSMRDERAALITKVGFGPYRGLFSLVSIVGIVLICYGFAKYRAAGPIPVWYPPLWTHHIVEALMWPASIMVAAAYIPGNIKRVLKHPMLAGERHGRSRICAPTAISAASSFLDRCWCGQCMIALRSNAAAIPVLRRFPLAA